MRHPVRLWLAISVTWALGSLVYCSVYRPFPESNYLWFALAPPVILGVSFALFRWALKP